MTKQGRGIVLGPGSPLRDDLKAMRAGSARTRAGAAFEDELDRVHALYLERRLGKLERVPIPTAVTSQRNRKGWALRVATAGGAPCDYLGAVLLDGERETLVPVVFDAKSCDDASYTHEPKQIHQLKELLEYQALGAEAFLLIRSTTLNVCYLVRDALSLRLLQSGGTITLRRAVFGGEGSGRRTKGDASRFDHRYPYCAAPAGLLTREDVPRWDWRALLEGERTKAQLLRNPPTEETTL